MKEKFVSGLIKYFVSIHEIILFCDLYHWYIYTTVLPLSCTDGRYFYHISVQHFFRVQITNTIYITNTIVIVFVLQIQITNTPSPNQESDLISK